ncbi:hypothetical protein ABT381_02060 [Streptomyces sp. NPDC000151]|uniref:hypothetical protein n=1 Tax=Streptomyces sp. NPDC000151 TaxID=3154244 RepID=UPI00331C277C
MPESVDLTQGPLIEPLSWAVHAFDVLPRDLGAHSYGLDDFGTALETFRQGSGRKIQLRPAA